MLQHIWRIGITISLIGILILVSSGQAATVTQANDYPTSLRTSTVSNHQVLFTTQDGVAEGETVTLTFSSAFDTSSITEDDLDVSDDGDDLTTAASCAGSEEISVVIAADVITLTVCASDGGAIAAGSNVSVEIGTNATSSGTGSEKIINPSTRGTYFISIGGTFGEFGSIALPITTTNTSVGVSASIPDQSSGGSGGGAPVASGDQTAPTISNVIVSSVSKTAATFTWTTDEGSDSSVDIGLTDAFEFGSTTSAAQVTDHIVTMTGLQPATTYRFRVRSKDAAQNQGVSATMQFSTVDDVAPVISNIQVVDLTQSSARVTWTTNEATTGTVVYGLTQSYGNTKDTSGLGTTQSVILTGLQPAKAYHARITSVDASSNKSSSDDFTFTTLANLPPANVSSFSIKPGDKSLMLSWKNPVDADLAGVLVLECTDTFPSGPTDKEGCKSVEQNLTETLVRTGLVNNTIYYYGVFAYDTAGQFASGAVGSDTPTASEEELQPEVPQPEELPKEPTEEPLGQPAGPEAGEILPTQPSNQPTPLGGGKVLIDKEDLELVVAQGAIVLSLGAKGYYDVFPGTPLRLQFNADSVSDQLDSLFVSFGSETFLLRLADQQGGNALYYADVLTPAVPQLYALSVAAKYKDGSTETVSSYLNVIPWGQVVQVIDDEEAILAGVKITLMQVDGGSSIVWDGSPYNQYNPVTTTFDGTFGWYVPNGSYRLMADADHFLSYAGSTHQVENHLVSGKITLIAIPPKPEEESAHETASSETTSIAEQLNSSVRSLTSTRVIQQAIESVRTSETAQEVVDIALPTIAVTAGASLIVLSLAFDFLPFLQYLFTAPILLLWRRKRKGYGVVYNAFSRVPVDLAVVRLYLVQDATQPGPGRLIQTRVTDKEGRFLFLAQPGTYRLVVTKAGFQFPTNYLKDEQNDGNLLDVYHGELITVTEKDAVITPNVPLDPTQVEQTQTPLRVVWQARLRRVQQVVALSGLLISFGVALIRPNVLAAVMVAIQLGVFLLVRRLAKPRKPKSWGIVYDESTKRPLSHVVARIFEPKYNKLLDTQVTDAKGRYSFLLGPSEYIAVFEKPGYQKTHVRPIDLTNAQGSQDFSVDVELHPN